MSNEGRDTRWTKAGVILTGVGVVVAVMLALAVARKWGPFGSSKTSTGGHPPPTTQTTPTQPPPVSTPTTPPEPPPWTAEASLEVNKFYELNGKPIKPLYSCTNCVSVRDVYGIGLGLEAEHGAADAWTKGGRPSHSDCIHLLESAPSAVALETSFHNGGVRVGGWLCATSQSGETLRLQYQGERQGGNFYRFAITGWPQS